MLIYKQTECLKEYVEREMKTPTGKQKHGENQINWACISEELDRTNAECRQKWRSIYRMSDQFKHGPYTAEEDAIILQRIQEWGDTRNGLWACLEKELGRLGSNIQNRYTCLKENKSGSSSSARNFWTAEMVCDSFPCL
jgi:hypothetical protein